MYKYTHTHTHTHMHTHSSYKYTHTHTHMHTHSSYKYTHTHAHTQFIQVHPHPHIHMHTHTHTQLIQVHPHPHPHPPTHPHHTYTHTYTYTHTQFILGGVLPSDTLDPLCRLRQSPVSRPSGGKTKNSIGAVRGGRQRLASSSSYPLTFKSSFCCSPTFIHKLLHYLFITPRFVNGYSFTTLGL